ncbi:MAG: hypothetical protein PHF05_06130 [Candidatus Izemoplasmatales bacterium]|nr:hypothetical protein [Candidatus Izemoplasmatales bacterium]
MNAKFKKGQVVLYQNGTSFELGIVKEVVEQHLRKDKPTIQFYYRVWYHTGDTSALTDERNLHEIKNVYAFLVMRRKADTSSINDTHARQLAASIIDNTSQLTELKGESYYKWEDALTELINKFKVISNV